MTFMAVKSVTDITPQGMEGMANKRIEVVLLHKKGRSVYKIMINKIANFPMINKMANFPELSLSSDPSPEEMLEESALLEAIRYCHEHTELSDEAKDFVLRYTLANSQNRLKIIDENTRKFEDNSITPAELDALRYIYRALAIDTLAMRRQIFFGEKSFFNI